MKEKNSKWEKHFERRCKEYAKRRSRFGKKKQT